LPSITAVWSHRKSLVYAKDTSPKPMTDKTYGVGPVKNINFSQYT